MGKKSLGFYLDLPLLTSVFSGGWSSLPGSELPAVLRRLGLPSAEGGPGDVAGGPAEHGRLLLFSGKMTSNPLREDAGKSHAVYSHCSTFISFFQGPKHILVFQHIPLYLKRPDEENDYFNLQKEVRQKLLDRFRKAGRKAAQQESC